MKSFKTFLAAVVTSICLDFTWIGYVMSDFYKTELHSLLKLKADGNLDPTPWAAGLIYVLIPLGVVAFVLPRASQGLWSRLGWGFLFGVVLYGVYDFTNYSLLKEWPLRVALVDIAWGGTLCALTSVVSGLIQSLQNPRPSNG